LPNKVSSEFTKWSKYSMHEFFEIYSAISVSIKRFE
jgi:hypothetical protein